MIVPRILRVLTVVVAMLAGALATSLLLPDGTKVTILTGEGGEFLGHGEVIGGELVLPALPPEVTSVVVFISREGVQLQILRGHIGANGALFVNMPGRGQVAFAELVREAGIAMKAKAVAGGPPGGVPPGQSDGGPPGQGGGGPPGGSPPGGGP